MEIEVGDMFRNSYDYEIIHVFVVVLNYSSANKTYLCEVYHGNRLIASTVEQKNTLLKMQRLTPLEKELM